MWYFRYVPPNNNGYERGVRNVKVTQKIFGEFKTKAGAQIYTVSHLVTDTCINDKQNILAAFKTSSAL